jgi:hypothetical protein
MKLTLAQIRKAVAADARLEKEIDLDEAGKAILYTAEGWTWEPMDGNRTVEGFWYADNDFDERDTLAYFKERLQAIQPEAK